MSFCNCSRWCFITFVTVLLAGGLYIGGFASHNWVTNDGFSRGLWTKCDKLADPYGQFCSRVDLTKPRYMVWCRALEICTLITLAASVMHYICTSCCNQCGRKCMLIWQMAMLVASAACMITTVTLFARYSLDDSQMLGSHFGYSFYLSAVAPMFAIMAAFFAFMDLVCCESEYDTLKSSS